MSYTDESDNNDNINEYRSESDSDDWDVGEEKTKVLSKKQKQTLAFQKLIRDAKQHFNNSEYLNFQQDLKSINTAILKHGWSKKAYQMPKFFVKHMSEIYNKIKELDPKNENNAKEQTALKKLKKNFAKDLRHFKQLDVFNQNPSIGKWANENSDLGEEENEADIEESDDGTALFQIADTAGGGNDDDIDQEEDKDDASDRDDDDDDGSASEEGDFEDDDSWSSWEDNKVEHKQGDSDEDVTDDEVEDGQVKPTGAQESFGIQAFDEETLAKMRYRSFWVKKDKRKKKKESAKQVNRRKKEEIRAAAAAAKKEKNEKDVKDKPEEPKVGVREKKKRGPTKWSVNKITQIFQSVLSDRGKTNVNRDQIVKRLEELIQQCELHKAEQARLTVRSVLISFYFDTASRKTTGMSGSRWRKTRGLISAMLKSLSKNVNTIRVSADADIRLILKGDEDLDKKDENSNLAWIKALEGDNTKDDASMLDDKDKNRLSMGTDAGFGVIDVIAKKKKLDSKYQWVHGNLLSFIKKLTNQLWTNLKSLGNKPSLYKKRKQNSDLLLNTYKKAVFYFGKLNQPKIQSEIEVLGMSVIHSDYNETLDELAYKINNKTVEKKEKENLKEKKKKIRFKGRECEILNLPLKAPIVSKAIFIFEYGTTRSQTQAMLYLIYNMAVHNRFELCRDLLLMSHLGSNTRIGATNIELQILYNRALASFAICSFSYGNWYTTMIILQELFSSNRYKILLAQGYTKAPIDDPKTTQEMIKMEQIEQQRMLPQHFHINNDLLEASHLLSSLFIEIPNMMKNIYESSGFIRNAYFRKVWHQYLRRDLRVPPENTKDYILQCGIYMQNGEWIKCKAIIKKLKMFINKQIKHPKYVIKKIFSTIKRECLRCYLYRYGSCYNDISFEFLSKMFDLSIDHCKQFISKLIITNHSNDIKFASFDELTQCIKIHQAPPTQIQRTALEYSDKLSFLIEQNEKLLGIYSRYSNFGSSNKYNKNKHQNQRGGKYDKNKRGGKFDQRGGNKYDQRNKNKYTNKNKSNQRFGNRFGNRFSRGKRDDHGRGGMKNQSNEQNNSNNKRQFGRQVQSHRTQLRSIRPSKGR